MALVLIGTSCSIDPGDPGGDQTFVPFRTFCGAAISLEWEDRLATDLEGDTEDVAYRRYRFALAEAARLAPEGLDPQFDLLAREAPAIEATFRLAAGPGQRIELPPETDAERFILVTDAHSEVYDHRRLVCRRVAPIELGRGDGARIATRGELIAAGVPADSIACLLDRAGQLTETELRRPAAWFEQIGIICVLEADG